MRATLLKRRVFGILEKSFNTGIDMTVFHHPKKDWDTLLNQQSWDDLCNVDFVHVMEHGSTERMKIFFKALSGQGDELGKHLPHLAAQMTARAFENPKWTASKITRMVEFFTELNRHNTTLHFDHQPLACIIEAIVRHSGNKFSLNHLSELFNVAVLRDGDLLRNLLDRIPQEDHQKVAQRLFFENKRYIHIQLQSLFFTQTAARDLPEFANLIVDAVCKNMRRHLVVDMSMGQSVQYVFDTFFERMLGYNKVVDPAKETEFDQQKIVHLENFVRNHQNAFTPQHWKQVLRLCNKIAKRHNIKHTPLLDAYVLNTTLTQAVDNVPKNTSPPKRKM